METTTPIAQEEHVQYAGFGKRFAAMLIDRVLIIFFCSATYDELHRGIRMNLKRVLKLKMDQGFDMSSYSRADHLGSIYFAIFLVFFVWAYYAGMESSPWKGTIGKKLLGLEVVRDDDRQRVSFLKATGRHFGKILSGAVFCLGFLSMLFSTKKQTWHDSMSGCVIIEK